MEMKRIVVVGCGSIGRRHARVLSRRADVALELCDVEPANLAQAVQEVGRVPTYDSLTAMLRSRPPMVIIATPHSLHADQSIAALQAGAHVLCEKPMSDTLASARRMLDAVTASDRVFSVGFTMHYHPALIHLRELIQSGALGTILHIHWHVGTYTTLLHSISRHQEKVVGALLMDYAHQPDLLYWWLRRTPSAVYAAGLQGGALPLQSNPNVLAVTLEYGSDLLATLHLNYVQHPQRAYCEIMGDRGWVHCDLGNGQVRHGRLADEAESTRSFQVERDSIFVAEHQAFFDAVVGLRAPESPANEAIVSMQIIEAALDSWRRRTRITVTDSTSNP